MLMKPHTRIISSLIACFIVSWSAFWFCLSLLPSRHPYTEWRISQGVAILCGLAAAICVWMIIAAASSEFVRCATLGALITGGIAFLAGFIGPIIFTPGSNQGPLLAFLFTGPLGVVTGAVGGALYNSMRSRRRAESLGHA
jgi:hypothetical protein